MTSKLTIVICIHYQTLALRDEMFTFFLIGSKKNRKSASEYGPAWLEGSLMQESR